MLCIRGSSSITRLEFHVSYRIMYCHKVFDFPEVKKMCEEIFLEVARRYEFVIKELRFVGEHVHLILLIKVTQSLDMVSKWLKGNSGYKILKEFPEIKRKYFWGSGLWNGVIYADSIGKDPEVMYNYVRNQGC